MNINALYEFPKEGEGRIHIDWIHKYLLGTPELLHSNLIFLPRNLKRTHWWGWAAIKPYRAIENALYRCHGDDLMERPDQDLVYGLLRSDSGSFHDGIQFLWFLNLASAYRDMRLEGTLKQFDYKKFTKTDYWMLGSQGPFGRVVICVDKADQQKTCSKAYAFYAENQPTLFPFLVPHHKYDRPLQLDHCNCGPLWLRSIADVLMSFAEMEWRWPSPDKDAPNLSPLNSGHGDDQIGVMRLPRHIKLGSLFQSKQIIKKILGGKDMTKQDRSSYYSRIIAVCRIMRLETQIIWERLRHLDLVPASTVTCATLDIYLRTGVRCLL